MGVLADPVIPLVSVAERIGDRPDIRPAAGQGMNAVFEERRKAQAQLPQGCGSGVRAFFRIDTEGDEGKILPGWYFWRRSPA